jgi:hypothetical protein
MGTVLLAGTYLNGMFVSTDGGRHWIASNVGLPYNLVNSIASHNSRLYAGTDFGLFVSSNKGDTWADVTYELMQLGYSCFNSILIVDTNLFAGTYGGVWKRPLSELITSVDKLVTSVPTQFSLDQNYPNPFNPSTTIKFELPRASLVNLSAFDILGRQVSVLVNERKDAGVYEVRFDGSSLASGVYFYRLQTGSFVDTKRLLLLK